MFKGGGGGEGLKGAALSLVIPWSLELKRKEKETRLLCQLNNLS